jgi:hypothetical protein
MASIKISELRPAGFELFQDTESFLNELGDRELAVSGGAVVVSNISQLSASVGISIVSASIVTQLSLL